MTLSTSNPDRTRRAERVLVHYAHIEGRTEELGGRSMTATLVSDLFADLMHYANFWNLDTANCIDVARMHFEAEEAEECREPLEDNPACKRLQALRRIAGIPLWGEPITDPEQGDKQELAEGREYDLANDRYEPSCDSESS